MDPTIEIYPPDHNRQFRFSMEAFQFIGQHDQVRGQIHTVSNRLQNLCWSKSLVKKKNKKLQ